MSRWLGKAPALQLLPEQLAGHNFKRLLQNKVIHDNRGKCRRPGKQWQTVTTWEHGQGPRESCFWNAAILQWSAWAERYRDGLIQCALSLVCVEGNGRRWVKTHPVQGGLPTIRMLCCGVWVFPVGNRRPVEDHKGMTWPALFISGIWHSGGEGIRR